MFRYVTRIIKAPWEQGYSLLGKYFPLKRFSFFESGGFTMRKLFIRLGRLSLAVLWSVAFMPSGECGSPAPRVKGLMMHIPTCCDGGKCCDRPGYKSCSNMKKASSKALAYTQPKKPSAGCQVTPSGELKTTRISTSVIIPSTVISDVSPHGYSPILRI